MPANRGSQFHERFEPPFGTSIEVIQDLYLKSQLCKSVGGRIEDLEEGMMFFCLPPKLPASKVKKFILNSWMAIEIYFPSLIVLIRRTLQAIAPN